jgi:polyhydroxybutyrate depolymerase
MNLKGVSWIVPAVAIMVLTGCGDAAPAKSTGYVMPSPVPVDCRAEAALGLVSPSPGDPVRYDTMVVDGRLRDYRMFTPPGLDTTKAFPLVLVFHGAPIDAAGIEDLIHFQSEATAGHFMAVYPDGCDEDWKETGGSYDVHFVDKLIDRLESQYAVDRSRVYVTGISAGAFMGYRLACDLADRIAAFASVAGSMWWNDCAPSRPVPIFEMHGTNDANVPYDGGASTYNYVRMPAVSTVIQRWLTFDGCSGQPTTSKSGITETSTWRHCQGGAVVQLETIVGGHHTWFGSNVDPIPHEPSSNLAVWSFLKQFTLPT